MARIEQVIQKYGLGWGRISKETRYQTMEKRIETGIDYYGNEMDHEKKKKIVANAMQALFSDSRDYLVVKDLSKFQSHHEQVKRVFEVPEEFLRSLKISTERKSSGQLSSNLKVGFLINYLFQVLNQEKNQTYFEKLKEKVEDQDKMKIVFHPELEMGVLRELLFGEVAEFKKEIQEYGVIEKLEQELKEEIRELVDQVIEERMG